MKNTAKTIFSMIVLLICVLMFTACTGENQTQMTENTSPESADNSDNSQSAESDFTKQEPTNITHVHVFEDWTVTITATCEQEGARERYCSCGETETEVVSATGHSYQAATCESAKTCSSCGAVDGEPNGHKWKNATCEKAKSCTVCGCKDGDPLGHSTDSGLCDNCGKLIGTDAAAVRNVIEIYEVKVTDIDSAGGVDLGISFTNKSNKTIKYIHFYVTPYNAVGDVMECEIRGYSYHDAYVTGPLEPGYEGYWWISGQVYPGHTWGELWYNSSIRHIELDMVKIEYMDGTVLYLSGDTLQLAFTDYPVSTEVAEIGWPTIMSHDSLYEYYELMLVLMNEDGISLAVDAIVDVRIVNSDGETVFSESYTITPDDFEEITYYSRNFLATYLYIHDADIQPGSTKYGTVYYHIYSPDGSFDFEEESYSTKRLPKQ